MRLTALLVLLTVSFSFTASVSAQVMLNPSGEESGQAIAESIMASLECSEEATDPIDTILRQATVRKETDAAKVHHTVISQRNISKFCNKTLISKTTLCPELWYKQKNTYLHFYDKCNNIFMKVDTSTRA